MCEPWPRELNKLFCQPKPKQIPLMELCALSPRACKEEKCGYTVSLCD